MDYREYEIEDLLLNPSFCDYCRGKDEQAIIFWEAWIAGHPERDEVVRQAKELYSLLNGDHAPSQYLRDEQAFRVKMQEHLDLDKQADPFLHEGILAGGIIIGESGGPLVRTFDTSNVPGASGVQVVRRDRSSSRKMRRYAGALVAAIVLAIGIKLLINMMAPRTAPLPAAYTRGGKAGERKSLLLPDGSKIVLNAGSTFKIGNEFNISMREVWLEGEAFFDVMHNPGKPFVIHTSSMDVKVLGTVFNIRDYPSDKVRETSLLKGSVAVIVKDDPNKEIILHPNEKIVLSNEKVVVSQLQPSRTSVVTAEKKYKISGLTYNPTDSSVAEVSWIEDRLAFNEMSFEEIAVRLERWYNVSIHFDDEAVKQYKFTATFNKNSLSQVLDALQLSRRFEYEIKENKQVFIKR